MRTLTILFLMLCLRASAASIPGTIVAAKITTGDTANTFSIGDTVEMGGTPKQVADITARDAISADRRTEGMTCWVIDESNEYRLVGGIANTDWVLYSSTTNVLSFTQFVTNDGSYLHLWGTVTNQTAPWALSNDGELFIGTNVLAGNLAPGFHTFGSVSYANSNQVPTQFFDMLSADYTGLHSYGLINGAAGYSPSSATWSLRSGDIAGSTNSLAQQAHSGSAWVTASVDGTNRAQLSYLGVWEAQGFTDDSGSPGMLVAYGAAGRLVPTNAVFTSNLYSTNIYVSNVYATNITVNVITNVNNAWITNLYVSVGYITNLYVDIGYITNLYSTTAFITNLTSVTAYITNLTVQTLYSATNYLGDLTVTNGITNLSLTPNTVLKADGGKQIASIANGSGALTNDNAGVFGWYPGFASTNYVNDATNLVYQSATNYTKDATNNIYQAGTNYANSVTNSLKPFPANASGALTNDGAGVVGWYGNFLDKAGGTSTGPQLTISATTNNPAGNEFVTGNWVRGLLNIGFFEYVSTNIISGTNADSPDQFLYRFESTIPQPAIRAWTSAFITNNGYIGSVSTTNTFLSLAGGVVVNSYIALSGSGNPQVSIKPEIYLSTDRSNWYGDFDAAPQALVPGVTQLYAFAVSFPAQTATNSAGFYIERRYKVTSRSGTPTVTFLIGTNVISGTNNAAHIAINAAAVNGVLSGVVPGQSTAIRTNGLEYAIDVVGALTNNIITLGTNHFAGTVTTSTNLVWGPDFAVEESCLSTNAAFTFAAPVGVDTAGKTVQWTLVNVTNTTAAAVLVTAPANCHAVGTMYVTNWTCFWFQCYANKITNCFGIPAF